MSASSQVDPKKPDEDKIYAREWSTELSSGETITTSTWSFSSAEVTGSLATVSGSKTIVLISGGKEGQKYYVTNAISTSLGQNLSKVGILKVQTEGVDA